MSTPINQPSSLDSILQRRHLDTFVGREAELNQFRANLQLSVDDPRRYFILHVAGQGGVGKTWLLQQFREVVKNKMAATAGPTKRSPTCRR